MKSMQRITLILALLFGIGFCRIANSEGPPGPLGGGGPMLLSHLVRHNMIVQVVSQLSGQSADAIKKQLKDQHLPAVLSAYKIDPKTFHEAMRTKVTALIKLLTDSGYLTAEQSAKVLDEMEKFAQRHQLMTLLVEKGLADGTITQEQAQILLPKHH